LRQTKGFVTCREERRGGVFLRKVESRETDPTISSEECKGVVWGARSESAEGGRGDGLWDCWDGGEVLVSKGE